MSRLGDEMRELIEKTIKETLKNPPKNEEEVDELAGKIQENFIGLGAEEAIRELEAIGVF